MGFLVELTELRVLDLCENKEIRGEGLAALRSMSKLKHLRLYGCTALRDEGTPHIGSLASLQKLGLQHTQVSDDGIEPILKLKFLTEVDLGSTNVTPEKRREVNRYLTRSQRP